MATNWSKDDGEGDSGLSDAQRAAIMRESLLRDSLLIAQVAGMHSHACEEKIVAALAEQVGVKEAEVDFASGQTSVIFDAHKITAHQLVQVVEKLGYRCGDYATGSGGGAVEKPAGS